MEDPLSDFRSLTNSSAMERDTCSSSSPTTSTSKRGLLSDPDPESTPFKRPKYEAGTPPTTPTPQPSLALKDEAPTDTETETEMDPPPLPIITIPEEEPSIPTLSAEEIKSSFRDILAQIPIEERPFVYFETLEMNPPFPGMEIEGVGRVGPYWMERDEESLRKGLESVDEGGNTTTMTSIPSCRMSFLNPLWRSFLTSTLLPQICLGLGLSPQSTSLRFESLSVGSGEAKRRGDGERAFGMVEVVLPSRFERGDWVARWNGKEVRCSGSQKSEYQYSVLARCNNVDVESQPITSGTRLCLNYTLLHTTFDSIPTLSSFTSQTDLLTSTFLEWRKSATHAKNFDLLKIVIPLSQKIDLESFDWSGWKGKDRATLDVLRRATKEAGLKMFLANLKVTKSGPYKRCNCSPGYNYKKHETIRCGCTLMMTRVDRCHRTPGKLMGVDGEERRLDVSADDILRESLSPDEEQDSFTAQTYGSTLSHKFNATAVFLWPSETDLEIQYSTRDMWALWGDLERLIKEVDPTKEIPLDDEHAVAITKGLLKTSEENRSVAKAVLTAAATFRSARLMMLCVEHYEKWGFRAGNVDEKAVWAAIEVFGVEGVMRRFLDNLLLAHNLWNRGIQAAYSFRFRLIQAISTLRAPSPPHVAILGVSWQDEQYCRLIDALATNSPSPLFQSTRLAQKLVVEAWRGFSDRDLPRPISTLNQDFRLIGTAEGRARALELMRAVLIQSHFTEDILARRVELDSRGSNPTQVTCDAVTWIRLALALDAIDLVDLVLKKLVADLDDHLPLKSFWDDLKVYLEQWGYGHLWDEDRFQSFNDRLPRLLLFASIDQWGRKGCSLRQGEDRMVATKFFETAFFDKSLTTILRIVSHLETALSPSSQYKGNLKDFIDFWPTLRSLAKDLSISLAEEEFCAPLKPFLNCVLRWGLADYVGSHPCPQIVFYIPALGCKHLCAYCVILDEFVTSPIEWQTVIPVTSTAKTHLGKRLKKAPSTLTYRFDGFGSGLRLVLTKSQMWRDCSEYEQRKTKVENYGKMLNKAGLKMIDTIEILDE